MRTRSSSASAGVRPGAPLVAAALVAALPVGVLVVTAPVSVASSASSMSSAVELTSCVDPDNGRPELQAVSFSPTAVDATDSARDVTLRMRVVDTGGPGAARGIEQVNATVGPDVPRGRGGSEIELEPVEGDWWQGTFPVPLGSTPGEWRLLATSVRDGAGNVLGDLDDVGHDFLAPHDDSTVTVTSEPDTTAPTITSLQLSKLTVDTRRKARRITVRVGAVDDPAGVESVHVAAVNRDSRSVFATLTDRDGDTFVGGLRFPRGFGEGRWRVRVVAAVDAVGNVRQRFGDAIDELGERAFTVRAPEDDRVPRVVWSKVRPGTIDIRRDAERIRVRTRLRDTGTGVSSAEVDLFGERVQLDRVRGTARDGVWTAGFTLEPCARFESRRGTLALLDRAGNWVGSSFTANVRLRRHDTEPPHATGTPNRLAAGESLRFGFSEDVVGVNDASIVVQEVRWPDPLDAPLPGAWVCSDRDGAETSCDDGQVREVVWTPEEPLAITDHRVTINPDGILHVTDLRGNPVEVPDHGTGSYFELRVTPDG